MVYIDSASVSRTSILVTGGAGFIAGNLVSYLLDLNDDTFIVNLDRMSYNSQVLLSGLFLWTE